MKKIIASILAAAMSLSCAASALADSRSLAINEGISDTSEIHILYNDALVKYEDVKPLINEDRVMIPFRAALENMGAVVDYSDSERLVTAAKDGITISFVLMDDTIYINNNGVESTMTMDVPMIIVEDRTLVPIRFMSEAFGMQVGWDGDTETVVIMDYSNYFEDFAEAAPNLTALAKFDNSSLNKSNVKFDLTVNTPNMKKPFTASGTFNSETAEKTVSLSLKIDAEGDKVSLKKSTVDIILKDMTLYIKADTLKQLAKNSNSVELKAVAAIAASDAWYSVDLMALLTELGLDEETLNVFETALEMNGYDFKDVLTRSMTTEGEAVFEEAVALASALDMYEAMDKYILIENKENGGYTISVDIEPADFADIINTALGSLMDEESLKSIQDTIDYTVKASVDNDVTKESVKAEMDLKTNSLIGTNEIKLTLDGDYTADEKLKAAEAPESSNDLTELIIGLLK